MTREIEIEKPAMDFAEMRGWWQCKTVSPSVNGFPDRFLARAGRIILIEFKAPGEPPSPQQAKRHRELRDQKVEVFVVDNLAEAKRILK
jgi:hypothetical protein